MYARAAGEIFSRKFRVKIFMLLLFQSLQKVQLEVNSVLGENKSPWTPSVLYRLELLIGQIRGIRPRS